MHIRATVSGTWRNWRALIPIALLVASACSQATPGYLGPQARTPIDKIPDTGSMKNFELVAHNPLVESKFNLPRGSNGGMAAIRDCVYVGSNIPYQLPLIVDVKDIKKPTVVGEVPGIAWKAMGVEAFDGIADLNLLVIPARGADVTGSTVASKRVAPADKNIGLVVYDVTDCRKPTIVAKIDAFNEQLHYMTLWRDPVKTDRVLAAVAYSRNPEGIDTRIWDLTGCPRSCNPKLVAEWGLRQQMGIPQQIVTKYEGGTRTESTNMHEFSFSIDGKRMHVAQYRYGYYQLDSSALAEGRDCNPKSPTSASAKGHCITVLPDFKPLAVTHNTHGATKIPGRPYVALQYEDITCPYGGINLVYVGDGYSYGAFDGKQVVEGGGGTGSFRADLQPWLVGSFNVPENNPERCPKPGQAVPPTTQEGGVFGADVLQSWKTVHNTLAFPNLLIVTWYGGGLRAVDISNPQMPFELGFFFNKPAKEVRWCYSGYATCAEAPEVDAEGVPTRSRSLNPPDILSRSFPITMNGYVVYTDSASGLYVMKYTGPHAAEIPQQGICAARAANTIKIGFDPCPPYNK